MSWTLNTQLGCLMNTTLVNLYGVKLNRGIRHSPATLSHLLRPRQIWKRSWTVLIFQSPVTDCNVWKVLEKWTFLSFKSLKFDVADSGGTCSFSHRKQQVPRRLRVLLFLLQRTLSALWPWHWVMSQWISITILQKLPWWLPDNYTAIRIPDGWDNITH